MSRVSSKRKGGRRREIEWLLRKNRMQGEFLNIPLRKTLVELGFTYERFKQEEYKMNVKRCTPKIHTHTHTHQEFYENILSDLQR